jgi:hypothetical protein
MAFMPRPPPVTLTITCGARRTTVASMRWRMACGALAGAAALPPLQLGLRLHLDDAVAG